ncbi:amidase [Nonomuraea harbinensis]|uniref:Amidase n=1 Tax=Nonomuraea harbinensis TaxID=1286938 RepID=A0ABW1BPT4_9ACTN|nr:amidase [Nonomuraea harbinensis]
MVRSAVGLAEGLRAGETTAVDVVREAIERVRWAGERFGGVAAVDAGWSSAEAERADRRLRAAGAVVVAISSAMADNPLHGKTGNPRDPGRAPGGSSSGTAALVAAGAVPLGLGSDSGGSVRLPAAWCGVAGLKPTFGRVPLTGHFPRCGSLEDGRTVIGPIAGTVADLAATLEVIAGPDGMDGGTPPVPLGDPGAVRVPGLRVATTAGAGGHEATARAVRTLAEAGAAVAERPLPDVREEALELTRRYWDRAGLSGEENVRVLWDWDRFRRRMLAATAQADVLVIPAAEEPPPWRESETADYLWTLPWSLTGAPVVVVPCGGSAVQVVGRPWEEHVVPAAAGGDRARGCPGMRRGA